MSEIKLTAPQLKLLQTLQKQTRYVASNYPPLKTLLRHNFVRFRDVKYSDSYQITEAGEQHLKSLEPS